MSVSTKDPQTEHVSIRRNSLLIFSLVFGFITGFPFYILCDRLEVPETILESMFYEMFPVALSTPFVCIALVTFFVSTAMDSSFQEGSCSYKWWHWFIIFSLSLTVLVRVNAPMSVKNNRFLIGDCFYLSFLGFYASFVFYAGLDIQRWKDHHNEENEV